MPGRPGQFVACHRTQEIVSKGLTFHDVYTVAEAAKSKFAGIPRDERKMVLDVKHMRKTFPLTAGGFLRRKIGEVKAVDDVTLDVRDVTLASLRDHGPDLARLVLGVAVMLTIAAVLEGFWSPSAVPDPIKWSVAAGLWLSVIAYLARAGRGGGR